MALYSTVTLTDTGAQLLASLLLSGSPLNLTALALGSGTLEEGDSPQTLTALKQEVKRLPLETINATAGAVVVTASLSTATVAADFYQRELGLYSGETLIAYGNAGDKADYIPAAGSNTAVTKKLSLRLVTGNVPVQYQPLDSSEFVTQTQLNETLPTLISNALSQYITGGGSIEATVQPATDSQAGTVLLAKGQISNRLAAVATSGSYDALTGEPSITRLHLVDSDGNELMTLRTLLGATCVDAQDLSIDAGNYTLNAPRAVLSYRETPSSAVTTFLGFAVKPYQLLDYGIDGVCMFIGDPSLPLLLRGSSISFAGQDFTPSAMASKVELSAALDAACYTDEDRAAETGTGTSNANVQYIELDPQHVPAGKLQSISLMSRTSGVPSTASYLGVYELGEDGSTYTKLGASSESVTQVANTYTRWSFPEGITLSGRKLRLLAQTSPDEGWTPGNTLGLRTYVAGDGDSTRLVSGSTSLSYVPQMMFEYAARVPHATDASCHLSAEEREKLAPLLERADELLALLDTTSNE